MQGHIDRSLTQEEKEQQIKDPDFNNSYRTNKLKGKDLEYEKLVQKMEFKKLKLIRKKSGRVVTPLEEILGEDAEKVAYLGIKDASKYFDEENDRVNYIEALQDMVSIFKPVKKHTIVFGMDP